MITWFQSHLSLSSWLQILTMIWIESIMLAFSNLQTLKLHNVNADKALYRIKPIEIALKHAKMTQGVKTRQKFDFGMGRKVTTLLPSCFYRTVFTFRSWLDLLDVVLAFWISILKISKLLQNCLHRVIDITSFEKHLESSLDRTPNFCRDDYIGLVLGPCTALFRLFLKHCTLTNKAVGTIWRALSKPPQRRQGPDLHPLWLLVGIPSAIRPELAFSRAEHSLPYSDVTIYIFAILYLSSMPYV